MPQYLKQYGKRLLDLGYTVVPIKPGTKRPDLDGWQNHATTPEDIVRWYSNGRANHGTGITARDTPAVDVDVLDSVVADAMSDAIDKIFGLGLLTRIGLAPKFLVPFRCVDPFKKLVSAVYTDGANDHKVEILGDGQQWVANHVHPDTGKPYFWPAGELFDTPRDSLPLLTRDSAKLVLDAFETLADLKVLSGEWHLKVGAASKSEAPPASDDFAAHTEPVREFSDAQVLWLVAKLKLITRNEWLRGGRILHHQYDGSEHGFDLWDSESRAASPGDYNDVDQRRVWESFGKRQDAPETVRSLIKEFGQPPKEEHKAAVRHPEGKKGDMVPFVEGNAFAQGFEDVEWVVEDIVPRAQVGVIYGASGSGKTFFAMDMACAIQRGLPWRDKHVEQADTFYIAAEAGNGIKKRIAAYLQHHGAGAMPWFVDYQPNLATIESVHHIVESVKLRAQRPGVIFVDTLALSHDGDENSSKDMSLVLRHCKVLADATGCLVILVHHTGKVEERGMRGSSALYAGSDFVLEISATGRDHAMVVDKLKDGERGAEFPFTLPSIEVGHTPRGKAITSCYVRESDKSLLQNKKNGKKPITNHAQIFIFDVFRDALGMTDSMTETELVEAVKAKQRANDDTPAQSQSIKGSIAKMVISGHICKEDESLSLPHSTHSTHSSSFE